MWTILLVILLMVKNDHQMVSWNWAGRNINYCILDEKRKLWASQSDSCHWYSPGNCVCIITRDFGCCSSWGFGCRATPTCAQDKSHLLAPVTWGDVSWWLNGLTPLKGVPLNRNFQQSCPWLLPYDDLLSLKVWALVTPAC